MGASDEFILKLLGSCELASDVKEWKRFKTASGDPRDGGIADFRTIEGVFTCLKFIHEMKIGDTQLIAKSNQKTIGYLNEVKEAKRTEYLKTADGQDHEILMDKEVQADAMNNGVLPYEESLLSGGSYL